MIQQTVAARCCFYASHKERDIKSHLITASHATPPHQHAAKTSKGLSLFLSLWRWKVVSEQQFLNHICINVAHTRALFSDIIARRSLCAPGANKHGTRFLACAVLI
jgi:hypothetical protein